MVIDPPINLPRAGSDVIISVLESLPLKDRFTCALVCKAWAEAAGAATRQIALKPPLQDLSSLQHCLQKHGKNLETLQLRQFSKAAPLIALPCPQLQSLLLCGKESEGQFTLSTSSQV